MKYSISVLGEDERFSCNADQHLLQGMQAYRIGMPMLRLIPVGCRGGGCGVCRVRIVSGDYEASKMSRKHVTEQEQAEGIALACRVYPSSDLEIELAPRVQVEKNSK